MNAKVEDINDLAKRGKLPDDIKAAADPVSPEAKKRAEDERRLRTARQLLKGSVERALAPRKQESPACTTGHYAIDRDTGGYQPSFVWVFGAETNWGKSSDLVMVTDENLKRGKRVLICSVEDPEELYGNRLLLRRARVNAHRFKNQGLTHEERSRIAQVAASGEDVPVFLDCRGRSVEWTAKRVKKVITEHGIDLIAFDYLQAFDQEKPQTDRRLQLNYIARTLTDVVKTAGKAGIIYSQVTVPDGGKRPDRKCIRDSRDVANAAEVVALGWTPDNDVRTKDGRLLAQAGRKCIIVDKNKDGPAKRLYEMKWDEPCACFDSVADPDEPPDYIQAGQEGDDGMPAFEEP